MKDLTGEAKMNKPSLLQKQQSEKTDTFDQQKIATKFSQFFANVDPLLANEILESENTSESYLVKTSAIMQHKLASTNELKDAFFSLELNESPRYDETSFNVIKTCFRVLCKHLKHVFSLSNETGVFPDKLEIARVSPV